MKALCWNGIGQISVETVGDPRIENPCDAIVEVLISSISGSDLDAATGLLPAMQVGGILGREFAGRVVETGARVRSLARGDRVVVSSVIGCGECVYCTSGLWGLCDNSNPNAALQEKLYGDVSAGIFGYSQPFGGYSGGHAQYVRVPFAEFGAIKLPDELTNEQVVFASDAFPAGYMAAEMADIRPGDTVAVWGCGAIGLLAIQSALHLGAGRVIGIDKHPNRLRAAQEFGGAEMMDYTKVDIQKALKEMTGGRGPDRCIDAVGMRADSTGLVDAYNRIKQKFHLDSDHPTVLRDAVLACRKGGTVSIIGNYIGLVDKYPIGAALNKGVTLKMGICHPQKYIAALLDHIKQKRFDPAYLVTHKIPLEKGPEAFKFYEQHPDECIRIVLTPDHL